MRRFRSPRAAAVCAERLGPARARYTTQETVADLEAVRAALGYERIALYGTSYGTKLAVAYARAHPDRVERLLLDSVVAPDGADADMRVLLDPRGPLDKTEPARRPITVEDLMTHRSGLAYVFSVPGPLGSAYGKLSLRQDQDRWLAELATLPLAHQPGDRLTYSHATDVLGIALSRIEGKPLADVLAERIFKPLDMPDTGFSVSPDGRRRAATMYQLDKDNVLRHDVMGPPPIADPPFCTGGAGLWSTVDDYLRLVRMLLGGGSVDGVRVLSEESVRLMRTDRLTDEQKRYPFLGAPFWVGRGFGLNLSVVTDPAKSRQFFGPGGLGTFSWPGAYGTWWQADPTADLILLYLIQNHPDLTVDAAAIAGNTSLVKLQSPQPKFVRRTYQALDF